MFFRRLLYSLFLIVLPVLSAYPEPLYSQENELEKANVLNDKVEQLYKQGRWVEADTLPSVARWERNRSTSFAPSLFGWVLPPK